MIPPSPELLGALGVALLALQRAHGSLGPPAELLTLAAPEMTRCCRPLVLGDPAALARGIAVAGLKTTLEVLEQGFPPEEPMPGKVYLRPLSLLKPEEMQYGRPTPASGEAMYRFITEAARMCLAGEAAGMATAPINKQALRLAGHNFPGHTELLAELTGTDKFVMMLAGDRLRVSLVTIHEPLAAVPRLLTAEKVLDTIRITWQDVHRYFKPNPRLAVLALNPHCGEGGLFGDGEERLIRPAIEVARREGIEAIGPLSADTLFHFATQGEYDAVVCMYHDQGLIPLKLLHFDDGVNVTLGLPILRTSVDHGTAYDLAGTGKASAQSMKAAIRMAADMARVKAGSH